MTYANSKLCSARLGALSAALCVGFAFVPACALDSGGTPAVSPEEQQPAATETTPPTTAQAPAPAVSVPPATGGPTVPPTAQPSVPVWPLDLGAILISFQPSSHPVALPPVAGLADHGDVFGDRGNGQSYGWNVDHTARAFFYEPPLVGIDQKFWSLVELEPGTATAWEIALPDGNYSVRVVAGGPRNTGRPQRISVEGVPVIDEVQGDYSPWSSATQVVAVTDGRLTVQNTDGIGYNRICFVVIVPQDATPTTTAS